ncbi:four helix bundle protein [Paludibacter sp. 221]|uniref:four helix bundle protein n=1 Tax=Paludibacter sp. 221 TaxID=2302939 RepID=UPI0013D3EEA3|nr:four helix bundle protein [Paludibacter sp. 221]NDV47521.1 four helix bundle protein [Paludibacter sp. 221]
MDTPKTFKNLSMWQKSHAFVLEVYKITEKYPKTETFGLVSQFRRAAISIPANIAEGYRRNSKAEKLRFFNIAQASLEECRYYILLSDDLNFINDEENASLSILIEEASKTLNGYCAKLSEDIRS